MRDLKFNLIVVPLSTGLVLFSACGKRTPPAPAAPLPSPSRAERPAPPPAAPPPTVEISASPTTIERGSQTTLRWSSADASSVVIDSGVGNVAESGSLTVSPLQSTTYTATATGPGGEAKGSTRVTVVMRSVDPLISSTDIDGLRRAIDEGRVQPVFFEYDQAQLSSEARRTLEENARWFKEFPSVRITIEGHCDERGTEEYNLALGDRRAQAARAYLLEQGVNGDRLQALSFGEERPFALGHDESDWRLNRRAHFVVEEQ